MTTQVSKTTAGQSLANGVRNGVKIAVGTTNPINLALLHFGKNVANGDTFGQALDASIDQTVRDYKKVETQLVDATKKVAEVAKPKDKVEMLFPMLMPVKRLAQQAIKEWNSLPTLASN